jgi:GNAT superfamily N-acetyltransferase
LGDKVVGAVVLTVEDEPDAALSYWQLTRRAGCLAAVRTALYDQVLEEALQPHECLVDFLAVSAEARGRGVGALLMRWAERTAVDLLAQHAPREVAAHHGVLMTLWVAADNDAACRLYGRAGYEVTKRTGESPWACVSSKVFTSFLGHPVWHKMSKKVPAPPAPGLKPPAQQAAVAVAAQAGGPVLATVKIEACEPADKPCCCSHSRGGASAAAAAAATQAPPHVVA